MNVTAQEVMHDLIAQPGLGMFAWLCFVFFVGAFVIFLWALKSGQMTDVEQIKFDMFDDDKGTEKRGNHV
jgi:nitrogen fixation-related uncharacterized protein